MSAGKAADVKRCYSMRKALALLDFDSESIADVKRLLLRAAFLPAFLRNSEGRRFLAYLFTLEVMAINMVELRAHLPSHAQGRVCAVSGVHSCWLHHV